MTPLDILFVSQWFDPEPGALRGLPLARWIQARGHRVQVLTTFPSYPGGVVYPGYRQRLVHRETMDGVEVVRVPAYPSHDRSALRRIAGYLSFAASSSALGGFVTRRPHVTFAYHPPPTATAFAWWRHLVAGTPYVYHVADLWPESVLESGMVPPGAATRAIGGGIRVAVRQLYRGAHAITVLSHGFKEALVGQGVPADKVHVVYNWCDEAVFRPVPRDPALAERLGLADAFVVMYAGNLGAFQALDVVLAAAERLADRPRVRFALVGTGPDAERLARSARARDIRNVIFVPRQPVTDMPAVNGLADAHLVHLKDLPFFRATIPSKTQVILASGLPCVMAVAGEAAALVRDADAGVTCAPDDPDALAAAVRAVHDATPAQRAAWGANGRRCYLKRMSLDTGAAATLALLERAAAR